MDVLASVALLQRNIHHFSNKDIAARVESDHGNATHPGVSRIATIGSGYCRVAH
jgi:hypothetical protein